MNNLNYLSNEILNLKSDQTDRKLIFTIFLSPSSVVKGKIISFMTFGIFITSFL